MTLKPNQRDRLFDDLNRAADTNLFSQNVTASEPPSNLKVTAALNNDTRLRWVEWNGSAENVYNLNSNASLNGGDLYEFNIAARACSEYNVRLGSAADVELLVIDEFAMEENI